MVNEKLLQTLIPIESFKAYFGIDDRENLNCRFCLLAATHAIEHYCKRELLRKKHFEFISCYGDLLLPLKEYPVSKISAVFVWGNGELLEPDFYKVLPDCGTEKDIPFDLSITPALNRAGWLKTVKVVYWAGYVPNKVPADLSVACLELATWNLNRYRGKRIGMTGNIRGAGKEGEHFELSMPENVRALLEPYRRRTI